MRCGGELPAGCKQAGLRGFTARLERPARPSGQAERRDAGDAAEHVAPFCEIVLAGLRGGRTWWAVNATRQRPWSEHACQGWNSTHDNRKSKELQQQTKDANIRCHAGWLKNVGRGQFLPDSGRRRLLCRGGQERGFKGSGFNALDRRRVSAPIKWRIRVCTSQLWRSAGFCLVLSSLAFHMFSASTYQSFSLPLQISFFAL